MKATLRWTVQSVMSVEHRLQDWIVVHSINVLCLPKSRDEGSRYGR